MAARSLSGCSQSAEITRRQVVEERAVVVAVSILGEHLCTGLEDSVNSCSLKCTMDAGQSVKLLLFSPLPMGTVVHRNRRPKREPGRSRRHGAAEDTAKQTTGEPGEGRETGRDPARDIGGSRAAQKQRTRAMLMEAALRLMAGGRSYTSLGLREITREAGVVPTSFYRHFADLDELGLALVEETGLTLRRLLRDARRAGVPPIRIIAHSVQIYRQFVRDHRLHLLFMASERWGGSPLIRRSIRYETQHFATEMAQDLRELSLLPNLSMTMLQVICGLVVNTMLNAASDFIDLPSDQPQVEDELTRNFVLQLRVIFLGATQWQERA
jgi:AcrR family transcriptional regulator